jgi:F0F1-type ATP synthase membrane subunit b/b'
MEKILQDRDRHIKGCSNAIVELEQKITNIENDIKHVREEELYNSAEIVHDTIKECESTLSARLDSLKAENETRVNTTQNEVRKEINNLWPGLKTQVEIAAQEVFEKLFLGRQENFKE